MTALSASTLFLKPPPLFAQPIGLPMVSYAVIVENDESHWRDETGKNYHFPNRYRKFLLPGTIVVYYKGKLRDNSFAAGRLSPEPHYFGIATIGAHLLDVASAKADWYAKVENYQLFAAAVPNKKPDGSYYESIPSSRLKNYWRDGVRSIDKTTYEKIVVSAKFHLPLALILPTMNDAGQGLTSSIEGAKKLVYTTIYERDPELRNEAVRIHGTTCIACNFNFEEVYGDYGKGYIHIHHRSPISEAGGSISVNPAKDLVPLCANCHSIVHRRKNSVLSIEQLISMVQKPN
ncbi:putative restriction endonuclease [Polaromonas sp. CG_9.7]|nr:putative restriction endonuclease [Polaromonas sp. CG_9.7]